jgi:hypothetical protein
MLALPAERKQNWTHFVRIGGNSLRMDRVDQIVRDADQTNVFGIETDNDIPGRYETFLDPAEKLQAIKAVAEKAHTAGNYAFVYIAGLECITANADQKPHSFMKNHPDRVQRKLTGEPAPCSAAAPRSGLPRVTRMSGSALTRRSGAGSTWSASGRSRPRASTGSTSTSRTG